jgi:aminopeptidase YwaD
LPNSTKSQTDVMDIFHHICDFGGRLSGTQSETDALGYVQEYFANLPTGQLQLHDVPYTGWSSSECWIEIEGKRHTAFALPRGGTLPEGGARLEVVDAGRGTPEELERLASRIEGRAVVVTHEFMFGADHVHRMKKVERAEQLGAAAFVIANPDPNTGRVSGGVGGTLAGFGISHTTRQALCQASESGSKAHFQLRSEQSEHHTKTIDWSISGSDPAYTGQEIIVCAHLDGHESSENAMDNASGLAVAMAVALELSNRQSIPCTVRVLVFSAEEFGLCASEVYVAGLSQPRRDAIRAVFNLDCVAGSAKFGAMISKFPILATIVEAAAKTQGADVQIFEPLLKNSDHYNFAIKGVPAMRLIAGFGDENSRLRNVLTEADTREMVLEDEMLAALGLTLGMVDAAI